MQNLVLVIVAIAGFAAVRLFKGRRRADLPMGVVLISLVCAGGVSIGFGIDGLGMGVVAVGLVIGVLPPYLVMAMQLARVQGRHRRVAVFAALAWVLQPTALRRLCRGTSFVVADVARGRCRLGEAVTRLRSLREVMPQASTAIVVEAACIVFAEFGDWPSVLAGLPDDLLDPDALNGLTFGARDAVVRALVATGRIDEAIVVVDGMELALVEERPFTAAPGDLAELPEAWLDRSRVRLAAALGVDVGPLLSPPSVLRALVTPTERREAERTAALTRNAGRAPDVRAQADRLAASMHRSSRLPSFLTSLRAPAPVVAFVAALNVLLLVPVLLTGSSLDATHLLLAGGEFPSLVRTTEPWRIATSMWLHAGPVHLALNVLFLLLVGNMVERLSGPRRFLAVYLISGLAGGIVAAFMGEPQVLVGASGAISGIFAAGGWHLWSLRKELPAVWYRRNFAAFIQTFVLNVLLGFAVPVVSMSAHGGGFAAGLLVAVAIDLLPSRPSLRRVGSFVVGGAWVACLSWGVMGLASSWQKPLSDVVPSKKVTVEVAGQKSRGTANLSLPVTWAELDPSETESGHQAWVGYSGQLAAVSISCGTGWTREVDGHETVVSPGDSEALAAVVADLMDDSTGIVLESLGNGFVLVRRATPGGGTAIVAHRMFPAGVLHLELFFEEGGHDEALLPGILAGADLIECEPN